MTGHTGSTGQLAVTERAGTVTLRGTVRSLHQRRLAVDVAKAVRGVRDVQDELIIDPRETDGGDVHHDAARLYA